VARARDHPSPRVRAQPFFEGHCFKEGGSTEELVDVYIEAMFDPATFKGAQHDAWFFAEKWGVRAPLPAFTTPGTPPAPLPATHTLFCSTAARRSQAEEGPQGKREGFVFMKLDAKLWLEKKLPKLDPDTSFVFVQKCSGKGCQKVPRDATMLRVQVRKQRQEQNKEQKREAAAAVAIAEEARTPPPSHPRTTPTPPSTVRPSLPSSGCGGEKEKASG
jgi:hypothetical protein